MTHFATFNAMKPSVLQNADRCVFVGNLSFFCTEIELAETFKHCGAISRLEVKRGRHGDSLLYAFVEFHESSSAQFAIHEMNGVKLLGRRMKVNWTDCKPAPTPGADQWVQVHVNFACKDLSLNVSEEFLESVFIQFGIIGDIIVKRHNCSTAVSGYAFIYFIDAYAAFRAIHGCKGINLEMIHFECALSRQYENSMSSQHGNNVHRGFKKQASIHGYGGNVAGIPSYSHPDSTSPPAHLYHDKHLPQKHRHTAMGKIPLELFDLHATSAHIGALPNNYTHRHQYAHMPLPPPPQQQSQGYVSSSYASLSSNSSRSVGSYYGLVSNTSSSSHHSRSFSLSSASFAMNEERGRVLHSTTSPSNWKRSFDEDSSIPTVLGGFSATLQDQLACEEFLSFLKPTGTTTDENFDRSASEYTLFSGGEGSLAANTLHSEESMGKSLESTNFPTSEAI